MQDNQKYFCLLDVNGKLLLCFIIVVNVESKVLENIVSGNEKVVCLCFIDVEFFFKQDKKQLFESFNECLCNVVFQVQFGIVFEKVQCVFGLVVYIVECIGGNVQNVVCVGILFKCDLVIEMVGEFFEMQGIVGYYYVIYGGEVEDVVLVFNEQYMLCGVGVELFLILIGVVVVVVDKFDILVGIFGIGMFFIGSKDFYVLCCVVLGVLCIFIEKQFDLDLVVVVNVVVE